MILELSHYHHYFWLINILYAIGTYFNSFKRSEIPDWIENMKVKFSSHFELSTTIQLWSLFLLLNFTLYHNFHRSTVIRPYILMIAIKPFFSNLVGLHAKICTGPGTSNTMWESILHTMFGRLGLLYCKQITA